MQTEMKRKNFTVRIDAPKEKVWKVLWDEDTYHKWTSVFSDQLKMVTDWKEGSEVWFLSGDGQGVYSIITRNIPNEYISFEHHGLLNENKKREEDKPGTWTGAKENYILKNRDGVTELTVEMDITENYENIFQLIFPQALARVKALSEQQGLAPN
jgi:hypothetical protein